jgi:hypothetical protein
MTHGLHVQDLLDRGLGKAAGKLGLIHGVFRPASVGCPLMEGNRFQNLHSWFQRGSPLAKGRAGWSEASWSGIFDRGYTKPGDYLHGPFGTYFVAVQDPLAEALCIRCSRTVSVVRPIGARRAGANHYSGTVRGKEREVLSAWPCFITVARANRAAASGLPGDGLAGQAELLLPLLPPEFGGPQKADLVNDDRGFSYVVDAVEESDLGLRIAIHAVTA